MCWASLERQARKALAALDASDDFIDLHELRYRRITRFAPGTPLGRIGGRSGLVWRNRCQRGVDRSADWHPCLSREIQYGVRDTCGAANMAATSWKCEPA
jgi:hypothetical protein